MNLSTASDAPECIDVVVLARGPSFLYQPGILEQYLKQLTYLKQNQRVIAQPAQVLIENMVVSLVFS
jgi:hypothetical protein